MAQKKYLKALIVLLAINAFACRNYESEAPLNFALGTTEDAKDSVSNTKKDSAKIPGKTDAASIEVYVCNSTGAKKYHYNRNCRGLKHCKHEVVGSSLKEAEAVGLAKCSISKCN